MSVSIQFILILWLLPLPINLILARRLKYKVVCAFILSLFLSGFLTSVLSWKLLVELSHQTARVDGDKPSVNNPKRADDRYSCFLPELDLNIQGPEASAHSTCPGCTRNNRRDDEFCFNCGLKLPVSTPPS